MLIVVHSKSIALREHLQLGKRILAWAKLRTQESQADIVVGLAQAVWGKHHVFAGEPRMWAQNPTSRRNICI